MGLVSFLCGTQCVIITSTSYRTWTRTTRCIARIVLYTEVDAQCDRLDRVVGRTSTVAGTVNLLRPTTVASLSH